MPRCGVPVRVQRADTPARQTLGGARVAPLDAARTARRAVPYLLRGVAGRTRRSQKD